MAAKNYRQVKGRLQGLTTAELYDLRKEIDSMLASHDAQVKQGKQKSRAGYEEIKVFTRTLKSGLEVEHKYRYWRWVDADGKRRSKYIGKVDSTKMAQPKHDKAA